MTASFSGWVIDGRANGRNGRPSSPISENRRVRGRRSGGRGRTGRRLGRSSQVGHGSGWVRGPQTGRRPSSRPPDPARSSAGSGTEPSACGGMCRDGRRRPGNVPWWAAVTRVPLRVDEEEAGRDEREQRSAPDQTPGAPSTSPSGRSAWPHRCRSWPLLRWAMHLAGDHGPFLFRARRVGAAFGHHRPQDPDDAGGAERHRPDLGGQPHRLVRAGHPALPDRRAASAAERRPGRHVAGRPPTRGSALRRPGGPPPPPGLQREARHHRAGPFRFRHEGDLLAASPIRSGSTGR